MKIQATHRRAARAGFSLAELMVVVVILGLLATLVVPNVLRQLGKANIGKVKADITQLSNAVQQYQIENNGKAPDSLEALVEKDVTGNAYLTQDKLPTDPWKNEYQYDPPGFSGAEYRIYSLGSDGEIGGEGDAADIDNIQIKNGEV